MAQFDVPSVIVVSDMVGVEETTSEEVVVSV